jgi:hypothetical protein
LSVGNVSSNRGECYHQTADEHTELCPAWTRMM